MASASTSTIVTNQSPTSEVLARCLEWKQDNRLYHCEIDIRWTRNDRTGEIEVKAYLGCAPDETTIILYPLMVWKFGYWNKGQTRKQMTEAKRELLERMTEAGFSKRDLTRAIEVKSLDYF